MSALPITAAQQPSVNHLPDTGALLESIVSERSHYVARFGEDGLWGGFADNLRGVWVARIFFRGSLAPSDQIKVARELQDDERVARVTDFGFDNSLLLTYVDCHFVAGVVA